MPIEGESNMAFPSESELKKIRKKLSRVEGTLVPGPEATALELFRWEICQKFVVYKRENDTTLEEMAKLLKTDKAKLSKILRNRVDSFSTDRLITMLQKLYPKTKLKVA